MSANLARKTDPITSHMAAANAQAFKGGHVAKIIDGLKSLGNATAHELSAQIGLTVVQIDRRMTEIARAGMAQVRTENGASVIRGGARVWEIKPEQQELFA